MTARKPWITPDMFKRHLLDALWSMANVGSENPLCSKVKAEAEERAERLIAESLLVKSPAKGGK